jgi:hypothetical protein
VLVSNGTSNVALAQSSLFWDTTNNRLGIQTAAPAAALDVFGDVAINKNYLYLNGAGTTANSIRFDSTIPGVVVQGSTSVVLQTGSTSVTLNGTDIRVGGSIIPTTDNAYDLGAPGSTFRTIYVAASTIRIGTGRISADSGGNVFVTNSQNVSSYVSTYTGPQGFQGSPGTGSQGFQGFQGNAGSQGFQGFQGVAGTGNQGYQGFQGTPGTGNQGYQGNQGTQGPQGGSGGGGSSTKITVATVTGTILNGSSSPALTTGTYGTYYSLTNSGFNTITLPNSSGADTGSFWVFRNNTKAYLNITVTYTGSTSGSDTGIVTIPPDNSLTIVFTSTGSGVGSYTFF